MAFLGSGGLDTCHRQQRPGWVALGVEPMTNRGPARPDPTLRRPAYAELREHRRRVRLGVTIAPPRLGPRPRTDAEPAGARTWLCFMDESEPRSTPVGDSLFIYGALLVPAASLPTLAEDLRRARADAGFPSGVPLKWHHGKEASCVPPSAHEHAKEAVLASAAANRCELFVSLCDSAVARGTRRADLRHKYGVNTVLRAVHQLLVETNSHALVVMDHFPASQERGFLEALVETGLTYPGYGDAVVAKPLPRFVAYSSTSAKAAPFASFVDVALGALGFALRDRSGPASAVGEEVVRLLSKDGAGRVYYRGLGVYPTNCRSPRALVAQREIADRLEQLGALDVPRYSQA